LSDGDDGVCFDSRGASGATGINGMWDWENHRCVSISVPFFFWLLFFLGKQKEK